jgi:hypothetical protein
MSSFDDDQSKTKRNPGVLNEYCTKAAVKLTCISLLHWHRCLGLYSLPAWIICKFDGCAVNYRVYHHDMLLIQLENELQ